MASSETSGHQKPAPDVYLEACRHLSGDPSDAVALEDSLVGAQAAREAGMFVIGVGVSGEAQELLDVAVRSLSDPRIAKFVTR